MTGDEIGRRGRQTTGGKLLKEEKDIIRRRNKTKLEEKIIAEMQLRCEDCDINHLTPVCQVIPRSPNTSLSFHTHQVCL